MRLDVIIKTVFVTNLQEYVDKILFGPQIVSIPTFNDRHAFLVVVQSDKIKISDWGGEKNKTRGLTKVNGKKSTI